MASIIVAESENRVIGMTNQIPWYMPADLKHFREITTNHTVIMGRLTFKSIYDRLKGPLPNRRNIVISSKLESKDAIGFEVYGSIEDLSDILNLNDENVFIIGGGQLYKSVLESNLISKIYLTVIKTNIKGDTYFPELDNSWRETYREEFNKDEKNQYDYEFIELVKNNT